ncbi:nuclear speckle splicing regulatory protein 1-like isoform X1 [Camellia sinensis]|uniref:nuclear speckle splicing regulatory protein 1-like isoform X1 n=2 Tax=Camellia sinensis TaxID=4442 RepID=UPI001035F5DA|nr:nuclear speckle splicing regulatory protein 1-like isoform X1 [Camellia sinensis]
MVVFNLLVWSNKSKMKKYGLQLRVPPSQQKKHPARPPLPPPLGFRDDDDDDIEKEISRQASKNKALKDIEEQHKKALEEDPSVFDYDGVYDEMKEKAVRPLVHDRQEKKPKYIQALIDKAKKREREQEIIYERKLAKERNKEDHLYADKDKFVTSAYKKKLAEQAKWMEEERRRQLREEKEDVTKKKDMTDFYFNLSKNVAFGAQDAETSKSEKQQKEETLNASEEGPQLTKLPLESTKLREEYQGEASSQPEERSESLVAKPVLDASTEAVPEQPSTEQPKCDHHKRNEDAVAAAKERFLARKRAK